VYINGYLCGSALTGLHPFTQMTVDPNACRVQAGLQVTPTPTVYKLSIFYAHRSATNTPGVRVCAVLRCVVSAVCCCALRCAALCCARLIPVRLDIRRH
jgi:hypothetical protein